MTPPPDPSSRRRLPAEIISHAAWVYHVFSPGLRDVVLFVERTSPSVEWVGFESGPPRNYPTPRWTCEPPERRVRCF